MQSQARLFSTKPLTISQTPLKVFLLKLSQLDKLFLLEALTYKQTWKAFLYDLAKLDNFKMINPQAFIKAIDDKHKKPSARADAVLSILANDYPQFTAEMLSQLFYMRQRRFTADRIHELLAKKPHQPPVSQSYPHDLRTLLMRLTPEQWEVLLVSLATHSKEVFGGHWVINSSLEHLFVNPVFKNSLQLQLINLDNESDFERMRAYLQLLMNDAPEITPISFRAALIQLDNKVAFGIIDRALGLEDRDYQACHKTPAILPDNPLKAALSKLSTDERNFLLHALCPTLWRNLAEALARKVQSPALIQAKIQLIDCSNRYVLGKAQALLDQVPEWPEVTPHLFLEALEEILPYKVSNMLVRSFNRVASSGDDVRGDGVHLTNEPMERFLQQYDFDEMDALILELCRESCWMDLARYLMLYTNQRQLNLITIDLIKFSKGEVEADGQLSYRNRSCIGKLIKIIYTCPEITPVLWVQGLKDVQVSPKVLQTAEEKLMKIHSLDQKRVSCRT